MLVENHIACNVHIYCCCLTQHASPFVGEQGNVSVNLYCKRKNKCRLATKMASWVQPVNALRSICGKPLCVCVSFWLVGISLFGHNNKAIMAAYLGQSIFRRMADMRRFARSLSMMCKRHIDAMSAFFCVLIFINF